MAEIVLLGRYEYKECNDCGHRYDLRNSKGQSVTKEEWDQLQQKSMECLAGGEAEERRAQSRRMEQYRQEAQEMKKSKKAAKGAKGAGQKKAKKKEVGDKKPSIAAIVRDFLTKNPKATDEQVVREFRKTHPDEKSGVRHVKLYRKRLGFASPMTSEKKAAQTKKPVKKAKADKAS